MASENETMQKALDEILRGVQYLIDQAIKENTFRGYNGIITSSASIGDTWNVIVNGKSYILPHYGSNTPVVGQTVKVFVPQGNMNLAYFIW